MFDDATCLYSPGTSYADATTLVMERVYAIADAVTRVVPRLRAAMRSETDTRVRNDLLAMIAAASAFARRLDDMDAETASHD